MFRTNNIHGIYSRFNAPTVPLYSSMDRCRDINTGNNSTFHVSPMMLKPRMDVLETWSDCDLNDSRSSINPPASQKCRSSRDLPIESVTKSRSDTSKNNCCCPPCCQSICCRIPASCRLPAPCSSFKPIPCCCKKPACATSCPRPPATKNNEPRIPMPPCCPPMCCPDPRCCQSPPDLGACFAYVDNHDLLAENVRLRSAIRSIKMKTLEECSCILDAILANYKGCSLNPCCPPSCCCPSPPKGNGRH